MHYSHQAPVLALTVTARKKDRDTVKQTLHMRNVTKVIESPNRVSILYNKVFGVGGQSIEACHNILEPFANKLLEQKIGHPIGFA